MDLPEIVVAGSAIARPDEDLTILVGGAAISGWQDVEVTLHAEAFPNSFTIGMTSQAPIDGVGRLPQAGDPCAVMLGNDLVITGFVDRDIVSGSALQHSIALTGRGKTQDLVDCSAEWPSGQLVQGTALDIARTLALPYSIGVELGQGAEAGAQVTPWALNYGETGAEIVQRVARNAGLLAYEDASGKLILAKLGSDMAASGITYGQNVQSWSVENAMDGRYSEVVCCSLSMAAWSDLPGSDFFDIEKDPNVPRHRRLDLVLEQVAEKPQDFTIKKAKWEIARRAGRGSIILATTDSWRDSGGALWMPNTIIPVTVPGQRGDKNLAVAQVTFKKSSETGTIAELVLMPPYGFAPEPLSLVPIAAADVEGPPQ